LHACTSSSGFFNPAVSGNKEYLRRLGLLRSVLPMVRPLYQLL
jgi:hypothetical protein